MYICTMKNDRNKLKNKVKGQCPYFTASITKHNLIYLGISGQNQGGKAGMTLDLCCHRYYACLKACWYSIPSYYLQFYFGIVYYFITIHGQSRPSLHTESELEFIIYMILTSMYYFGACNIKKLPRF